MTIKIPGVDAKKGLDLYDGELDLYLTVLRSYADNIPVVLDKLRKVTAETLPNYADTVHGIKGASATIAAEEISNAAMKLENMAMAGDLSGVLAENDFFLKRADCLLKDIQKWLEQNYHA